MEIQLKYDGNKPGKPGEIIVSIPITFNITPAAAGRQEIRLYSW
jgi:hypothetical protein